jgi:iron complex outermembrane receptor protein
VTPVPPHFVFPIDLVDNGHARTYGGEAFATWNVTNRWRLSPGYSLIHLTPVADPLNPNSSLTGLAGGTPKHQIQFRSGLALRSNLDWDTSIFFVGQLSGQQIPAYTRLDMQLRWRIRERIELGVTGQNLLAPHHAEFVDAYGVNYTQVQRSVFGKITWGF